MRQNIGTSPAPSSKSCYLGCPGGDAELSRPRHEGQEHREQAGGEPEAQQDAPAQGVRRRGTFFFFFQVFSFTFNFEVQHPHRTIYQVMCSFVYNTRLASRTRFYFLTQSCYIAIQYRIMRQNIGTSPAPSLVLSYRIMRQNIGTSPAPSSKSCYLGCPGGDAELSRPRHEGQEHREQAGGEPPKLSKTACSRSTPARYFFFFFSKFLALPLILKFSIRTEPYTK